MDFFWQVDRDSWWILVGTSVWCGANLPRVVKGSPGANPQGWGGQDWHPEQSGRVCLAAPVYHLQSKTDREKILNSDRHIKRENILNSTV